MAGERNETIDVAKGLAILSVICAHCNAVSPDAPALARCGSLIISNFGSCGVICFFALSGYLFHFDGDIRRFAIKKARRLCAPWVIAGTCVYLYVHLRKPPLSLGGWACFVLGDGSYLYYVSMLIVLYGIFALMSFRMREWVLVVCELVTMVSVLWFHDLGILTPYLNPFNWIGYFAAGVQASRYGRVLCFRRPAARWSWQVLACAGVVLGWLVMLVANLVRGDGGSYWGGIGAFDSWLGCVSILAVSHAAVRRVPRLAGGVATWGRESYFIYLWHMPMAGMVARLMFSGALASFVLLRPVLILLAMLLALVLLGRVLPPGVQRAIGM